MTELAQSLRLYLADTLTSDVELLADLFKGVRMAVGEAEAHGEHALLTGSEGLEHVGKLLLEQSRGGCVRRGGSVVVGDEVAEVAVLLLDRKSVV